jgi:molybdate transport system ATP-binding protein
LSGSSEYSLKVENLTINRSGHLVLDVISFSLNQNESLAITGPSGSGKTILGLALAQKVFYRGKIQFANNIENKITWIGQQHHFKNLQHTNDLYYQQRFNSYDTEETETVAQSLGKDMERASELLREMKIEYLKDERLIQLSNGENKKLQLLEARLEDPSVMIMDQPFVGLDKETRKWLHHQLEILIEKGILIVLITSPDEIPVCISKVLTLENGRLKSFIPLSEFKEDFQQKEKNIKRKFEYNVLPSNLNENKANEFDSIIEMKSVTVAYGDKIILKDINWKVSNCERWLLTGANGAGKSTLLSLISGDNPKAYANDIYLFGKKRGSGESIWDIKKKIGFISPELHLYFNQSSTCFETVASGLFDTNGLFRQISDEDTELVDKWMKFCGVKTFQNKRLGELSLGEQRSVLLTRALVKDPPLLLLDEPCQGLDTDRKEEFLELINEVCIRGNKTLILVSHYENERPACISHFIKLDKGKVVEIK